MSAINLFMTGEFTLNSGAKSDFKIECDALSLEDWDGLACLANKVLKRKGIQFGVVHGVPRGGIVFAKALEKYITPGARIILFADDVLTTGGSMERECERLYQTGSRRNFAGIVAFARTDKNLGWIHHVWQMEEI